ncbi:MAG: cytochrome c family protein [Novosphingobium sp.]
MASIGVIWTLDWFTQRLLPDSYPGELAYQPMASPPPPVDLVAVQRNWPASLNEPGQHERLAAYMHNMERQALKSPAVPQVTAAQAAPVDLGSLLALTDVNAGKGKAQVCMSCHNFDQGGPDRVGPNLWGVIGRNVASRPGFAYSSAMAAQRGTWTYDRLFTYLASPARAVPGNKMGFAGFTRPEDRAAVIRYLATLTSNPLPLPPPHTAKKSGNPS